MSPLAPDTAARLCICGHYRSEHDETDVRRCRVRAFFSPAGDDGPGAEFRCDCPGFEEDPNQEEGLR
jgi:hypothetical protein